MKLAILTDAWQPQVNGVVTTLMRTRDFLRALGHDVLVIGPDQFATVPCPTYPEIRLALMPGRALTDLLNDFEPEAIHVATEGPLGHAGRRYCIRRKLPFTTSYHTQFPQYLRKRLPIPEAWTYALLRRHHSAALRTLVASEHQRRDLITNNFRNVHIWSRGVDTELFRPCGREHLHLPRPIWLYAGRVAVEKNLEAFLGTELGGSKVVVGGGPDLARLRLKYPGTHFVGYKFGQELAQHMSSADVFVFPSRTDTFGLVMLEAMACGTPVAAYPVTGPIDVVREGINGCLDDDLASAAERALQVARDSCRDASLAYTWERATGQFLAQLAPFASDGRGMAALPE